MDVGVACSLSDIEAGLDCLNSPSFLSRFFSFPGIEIAPQSQSFWTWSALVLALIAALSKLSAALNLLIVAKRPQSVPSQSQPLLCDEDDFTDDEDEEATSLASDVDDQDDDDDPTPSLRHRQPVYEDRPRVPGFLDCYVDQGRQSCSFDIRPPRNPSPCWADFAGGDSVVKLWDGRDVSRPFFSPAAGRSRNPGVTMAMPSSSVLVAAASVESRNLSLSVWDRRIGRRTPAIHAEWMTRPSENGLTVGDLRNVSSPVAELTEAGEKSWWDANAVVVTNDAVGDYAPDGCVPPTVPRWRDVVWRYLL